MQKLNSLISNSQKERDKRLVQQKEHYNDKDYSSQYQNFNQNDPRYYKNRCQEGEVCFRTTNLKTVDVKLILKDNLIKKGPFKEQVLKQQLESERLKKKLGLESNLVKYDTKFIYYQNILEIKCQDKLFVGERHFSSKDNLKDFEFIKILMFRYIIGTKNNAFKNILFVNNKYYSVNDPAQNLDNQFILSTYNKFLKNYVEINKVKEVTSVWYNLLENQDQKRRCKQLESINTWQ